MLREAWTAWRRLWRWADEAGCRGGWWSARWRSAGRRLGPDRPDVAVALVRLADSLAERMDPWRWRRSGSGAGAGRFMEAKWGPQRSRLLFRHALQVRARLSARRGDLEAARKDYGEVAAIREFLDPAP